MCLSEYTAAWSSTHYLIPANVYGWQEVWGHLGNQFSELRFRATLGVALVHKGGGGQGG